MKDSYSIAFEMLYRGSNGASGPGSTVESAIAYCEALQLFLRLNKIRSVVDLGCGDWEVSRLIDWTGIDYLGIDVVVPVVRADFLRYSRRNVRFQIGDIRQLTLPDAELFIMKDVLQHWPNSEVNQFLTAMLGRRMLVTNTFRQSSKVPVNSDISPGRYRPLDLRAPPFRRSAEVILEYEAYKDDQKQVLLLK